MGFIIRDSSEGESISQFIRGHHLLIDLPIHDRYSNAQLRAKPSLTRSHLIE